MIAVKKSLSVLVAYIFFLSITSLSVSAATTSEAGSVFRDCPNCPELVVVAPGKYLMGISKQEIEDEKIPDWKAVEEEPQHEVTIADAFAIGKYPVTKGEFAAFVAETGYVANGRCTDLYDPDHIHPLLSGVDDWRAPGFSQNNNEPVICVNLQDARRYLSWLSKKTSLQYRLPTEEEWEYAARAGTTTYRYWGNNLGLGYANCRACNGEIKIERTTPVGSFPPNLFGLYDMLGNVSQMLDQCKFRQNGSGKLVSDYSLNSTREELAVKEPCPNEERIVRGGSWATRVPSLIRSAARSSWYETHRLNILGFRVLRELSFKNNGKE